MSTDGPEKELEKESWCREFKGALVRFGNGATVAKVNFPSDFSALRISNLPRDSDMASVIRLLARHKFAVTEDCIRITGPATTSIGGLSLPSADVQVEDPRFARSICSILRSDNDEATAIRAVPINVLMPEATNSSRVDSRKVHCSWPKPTRTARLNFDSEVIAGHVAGRFANSDYKVRGQAVGAALHRGGRGYPRGTWSVTLHNVPLIVESSSDVTNDIHHAFLPYQVEMRPPRYDAELFLANATVESLLLGVGPLEWWQEARDGTLGKRFKAWARFVHDQDARDAVMKLHDKPMEFDPAGKLTISLVHCVRLKMSARVYHAVEDKLERQGEICKEMGLSYSAYSPSERLWVVKIEGEVNKEVADTKATLERIIKGDLVQSDEGTPLWEPSLAADRAQSRKLKQIEREHEVIVTCDKQKSQLRLTGRPRACRRARTALLKIVSEAGAQKATGTVFAIELDKKQVSLVLRGGFQTVAAAVGKDKVTLNITSVPRRILVTGSTDDLALAKQVLQQQLDQNSDDSTLSPSRKPITRSSLDCVVCWTEAENPIRTSCGHVYCGQCFEDMCNAGATADGGIRCQGNAAACRTAIVLEDLQSHLSPTALEGVLDAAFEAHLARHPGEVRPCPTPDCDQLYRTADPRSRDRDEGEGAVFTCSACLVAICTACRVGHVGLSCAENRSLGVEAREALQATRLDLGIKDCPRCGIMLEKREGCNHMTCSCGAHICWVCLETFEPGEAVYNHMREQHGNIGGD